MRRMRATAERVFYSRGFFPGRATPPVEVDAIIDLLVPVESPSPLVRVGGPHDGGYLIPDDVSGIQALFSPGVAESWSFEQQMLDRYGVPPVLCDRFDPSRQCPFPVDDVWLGASSGVGVLSLADWVNGYPTFDGDLMLQMDIEGAEYLTLLAAPLDLLRRFRIAVIELHDLHRIADQFGSKNLITPTLRKLSEVFVPVHLHPNNRCGVDYRTGRDIPRVLEVTYLRRDRVPTGIPVSRLPHDLDAPNAPNFPEVALSGRWLRQVGVPSR